MEGDLLTESLLRSGVERVDEVVLKLNRFAELLEHWQGKVNLTTITGREKIRILHFADCVRLLPFLAGVKSIIDLGSGAGLPGIVLGLCRPDIRVCSVEKVGKKIIFQRTLCRELGLQNIVPVQEDIFTLAGNPDYAKSFDLVVTRAWTSVDAVVEAGIPFIEPEGGILSMTSEESTGISDEIQKLYRLSGGVVDRYRLPFANKEHLLWKYTLSGESAVQ